MLEMEIHRDKKDKNPVKVQYDFGATIEEAVKKFDGDSPLEKVVFACFLTGAKLQLVEFVRRQLSRTKTVVTGEGKAKKSVEQPDPMPLDQLATAVAAWKPEIKRRGKSPITKAEKVIGTMSKEERAELLRRLQSHDDDED